MVSLKVKLESIFSGGVAADSLILLFVKCLVAVARIIQTMVLSRALPKSEYGTYSQAILVISLFAPIFSLGLDSAVNYFYNRAESTEERKRWVNTIITLSLVAGLVGGLALFLFRDAVGTYYRNGGVAVLMGYIALRPCLQNLASVYQNLYISSGMSRAVAFRNLAVAVAQVAVIALATVATTDLTLLFVLLLLLDFVQVAVFSVYYRRKQFAVRPLGGALPTLVRPVLSYALPMLLATSVATLSLNLGRLLVSGLMSIEDFALYSNMSQELPFSFVISSFTAVVTPTIVRLLANGDRGAFQRLWGDYVELGYLVTWPLCAAAIALAPQLVEFLYSSAYLTAEGVAVFRVCVLSCALRFTYFGLVPTAMGQSRIVFLYSLIALLLSLPLTMVMFDWMGMVGAAAASFISNAVVDVFYLRRSAKLSGTKVAAVFRLDRCGMLAGEMVLLGILSAAALPLLFKNHVMQLFIGFFIVAGGCYLLNMRELMALVRSMNTFGK